jgi:hypothetical protein
MTTKERKIQERALELKFLHEGWCDWKALSVAIKEEIQKQKKSKIEKFSIRQIGLLEYWD